jgi:hypothetical protein
MKTSRDAYGQQLLAQYNSIFFWKFGCASSRPPFVYSCGGNGGQDEFKDVLNHARLD